MADIFGKFLIRPHVPRRRAWFVGTGAVGVLLLGYSAFELGRYDAGFRVVDSVRGALAASSRIRELEAVNTRQSAQLEASDVARRVDREGYKQIEKNLGDMQSQIARLNQDLSFYRGLVQPDASVHVKIQRLQIAPDGPAGQFHLKFVLMQTGKPDTMVSGSFGLTIDGLLRGRPMSLGLAQVSPSRRSTLAYAFRYFQDYDEVIRLPSGFEPTRVAAEVRNARDANHVFQQAFAWKAQGMSVETDTGAAARSAAPADEPGRQTVTD